MTPLLRPARFATLIMLLMAALPSTARDAAREILKKHDGRIDGFTVDSVSATLSRLPLGEIEGLWKMTDDGALFAICDTGDGDMLMIMVDSPDRSMLPGTVIGAVTPTAKPGTYDARMSAGSKKPSESSRPILIRLRDDSHMTFSAAGKGLRLNLWRLVPYLFRYSIRRVDNRPDDIDGAIKIYPRPMTPPATPRYL